MARVLQQAFQMSAENTNHILSATSRWLRPVVYVLLRCGITWHQFCDLAKRTYVDVATAKFGKRGRPTNVSRTAILTGLTRRDVRLVKERLANSEAGEMPHASKASQILSRWHQDADFLEPNGVPLALPLEGESASFHELLRRSGAGDVRPATVMRELIAASAIRKRDDGRLEVLKRSYIPRATDEQLIRLWGTVLADVANTYVHNMTRTSKTPARFERAAKNERIPLTMAPAFREFLEREGQGFLERVDAWLTENEVKDAANDPDAPSTRMGAGVYHIQD
jgi:hypothetical protein